MTKSALAQATKTMAIEWAGGQHSSQLRSAWFHAHAFDGRVLLEEPERSRWMFERIAARRAGLPEDLAGIIVWLASPASAYVTGQIIAVDGGFTAGASWEQTSGSR